MMMIKVRYGNSFEGRVWQGRLQGEAMIFMIGGGPLTPWITTGIARSTLQQFYDYPRSDEPSDNLI